MERIYLSEVFVTFRDEHGALVKRSLKDIAAYGLPTDLSSGEDMEMLYAETVDRSALEG